MTFALAAVMLAGLCLTGCGGSGFTNVAAEGQVIIGTSTEPSGDWSHAAFGSNNATDNAVLTLTDDCETVVSDHHHKEGSRFQQRRSDHRRELPRMVPVPLLPRRS